MNYQFHEWVQFIIFLHILHANWSNELNVEAKDASQNFDLIVTTSDRIHVRLRVLSIENIGCTCSRERRV